MNTTGNESSGDSEELWKKAYFYLEGVAMPVVSAFGILGNLVCMFVLSKNKKKLDLHQGFTNLLICLAVFDFFFLLFANMVYPPREIFTFPESKFQLHVYLTPYLSPLINIALTGSVYTVMAIALERYTTITNSWFKVSRDDGKMMILVLVLFSTSYNFVKFFEYQAQEIKAPNITDNTTDENEVAQLFVNATWLRRHPVYSLNYIVVGNFIVMNLIPVIVLATLNFLIYRTVSRATALHNKIGSKHRRDSTMATLLSSIVAVFFVCHSTKIITNVYEAVQMIQYGTMLNWSNWAELVSRWNHLMLATNSSINIIIYVAKDFKFRQALHEIIVEACTCGNKAVSNSSSTELTNLSTHANKQITRIIQNDCIQIDAGDSMEIL